MAAAHCVMKRMLIPILRTAQARVFVEQPPECGRVSGVGGTHGLPNSLALLVVEFQWLNHKTIRPMFAADDIPMSDASASRRRTRLDENYLKSLLVAIGSIFGSQPRAVSGTLL